MLTLFPPGGNSLSDYKQVLGPRHLSYNVERQPGERKIRFYVEGLAFPDADFLGLVSLSVSLVDMGVRMALEVGIGAEELGGPVWRFQGWAGWAPGGLEA